jgi:prepilin-type N-terminal cleavage/methylation domain-containing protein/prepilin-type processing-associated H-X9-DG protein
MPRRASAVRRGFTLIELLVVIAIIAVLIALLVPAVQKVRESAARTQCANNLKQMGLALHAFHDTNKGLPPGYLATAAYPSCSPGWGWAAFILPYIEQGPLHYQINFASPVQAQAAITTVIPIYVCPSDVTTASPFAITDAGGAVLCQAAPSSYAATVGPDASDVADPTGDGVFYRNSRTRMTDITDGTSQTVMAGDRAWAQTHGIWAGAPDGGVVRAGNANPWTSATAPAPCFVLVHNNWINILTDSDGGLDDFSSMHTGGANLLFADGSVHFLRSITIDGVEHRAFWAMGTRSRNDSIGGIDY